MSTTYKEHTCTFPRVFNKRCWTAALHIAFSSFCSQFFFSPSSTSPRSSPHLPFFLIFIFSLLKIRRNKLKKTPKQNENNRPGVSFVLVNCLWALVCPGWHTQCHSIEDTWFSYLLQTASWLEMGLCAYLPFSVMGFCLVSFTHRIKIFI